jgi:ribonuclease BN (tRNA processing enzyme)
MPFLPIPHFIRLAVTELMKGVDLLYHEATFTEELRDWAIKHIIPQQRMQQDCPNGQCRKS